DIHPVTDQLLVDVGSSGIGASYDSGTGVLTLTGTASVETYRQVLATVRYSSSAVDPAAAGVSRMVTWQVNDGSTLSAVEHSTLGFIPVIDLDQSAPGTGFSATFTENGSAVAVADSDLHITQTDTPIAAATVVLTNAQPGDSLAAPGATVPFTVDTSVPGRITLT